MKEFAEQYLKATQYFLDLVSVLSEDQLNLTNLEGWTPRQVIHHVADSEAQSYARLRRLIAEPGSTIQGYDEAIWAENSTLAYRNHQIDSSLDVFKAVRQSSYELLQRIDESLISNTGIHTESGEYSVKDWINTYIKHPIDHAKQIREIIEN